MEEKDETEMRLEKMLFGDEAGFLSSLAAPTSRTETALARVLDDGEKDDAVSQEDQDMDDVPDEEVNCSQSSRGKILTLVVVLFGCEHECAPSLDHPEFEGRRERA